MNKLLIKALIVILEYIKEKHPALLNDYIEDAVAAELRKRLETISTSIYKRIFK